VLAAFDTPQALKDAVIKEKESKVAKILKKIKEEDEKGEIIEREGREISIFIINLTDKIIEEIKELPMVMEIKKHHSNRITIKIDEGSENGVNTVIRTILVFVLHYSVLLLCRILRPWLCHLLVV